MNIGILGTGNVGEALGTGWARKGHRVFYGSREPQSARVQEVVQRTGGGATAVSHQQAVQEAEVVVIATPWSVTEALLTSLSGWTNKIVIDATNPIGPGLQLTVGTSNSGGELVAKWASGSQVVKAFNSTGYNNMLDPVYQGESTTMFIAGDDSTSKAVVAELAQALGFDVADVGNLAMSRWLEPLAMVWINLAMVQGLGREIAFKLVHR